METTPAPPSSRLPTLLAVAALLCLFGLGVWAVQRSGDGPRYPVAETTTTTQPPPEEHPAGTSALATTPYGFSYAVTEAGVDKVVTGRVDPTTASALLSDGDVEVLLIGGVRYERLGAEASGQLPEGIEWVRRSTPAEAFDLATTFPVVVPTPAGDQNLLEFANLPGVVEPGAPPGSARYRLDLPGVTDTSPPSAAAVWEVDAAGVLVRLEAAAATAAGERDTVLTVSDVGAPVALVAPPPQSVVDEAALPAAVAQLLS